MLTPSLINGRSLLSLLLGLHITTVTDNRISICAYTVYRYSTSTNKIDNHYDIHIQACNHRVFGASQAWHMFLITF